MLESISRVGLRPRAQAMMIWARKRYRLDQRHHHQRSLALALDCNLWMSTISRNVPTQKIRTLPNIEQPIPPPCRGEGSQRHRIGLFRYKAGVLNLDPLVSLSTSIVCMNGGLRSRYQRTPLARFPTTPFLRNGPHSDE